MRVIWFGTLGYPTETVRDDALAAFEAALATRQQYLTPSTWDIYPTVPAGLTPDVEVDGMPGFTFCWDVDDAWSRSEDWGTVSDIAQEPSEGGGQQLSYLPA